MSRSTARARGWGIPVPGDPGQVIYVWWDALGQLHHRARLRHRRRGHYQRWWAEADRRIHLVGKGVLRFHAVYWPAILLSAGRAAADRDPGARLPDRRRRARSASPRPRPAGAPIRPRWSAGSAPTRCAGGCCARCRGSVTPTSPPARLVARANEDLANGLGNLVSRVISLVHRYRQGQRAAGCRRPRPPAPAPARCVAACQLAPDRVAAALADFDFRAATTAIWDVVDEANRYVERPSPGTWPGPSGPATPARASSWTPRSARSSRPAGRWPPSWRRSCPTWPPGWRPPATTRPALPSRDRCSRGSASASRR